MTVRDKQDYERFKRNFSRRLRFIAADRDVRLKTIADAANIEPTHIYKYAHGQALPGAYHLAKLSVALGVDANVLLGIKAKGDAQ